MVRHVVVLTMLIGGLSAALIAYFLNFSLLPALASRQGEPVDNLFKLLFSIAAVFLSIVIVFLVYSVVAFRRQPGDETDGPPVHGHAALETAWTLIPLAIVVALGIYGAVVLTDITKASPSGQELEVEVTAFQFGWSFAYPQYSITSPELRLPLERPVLFKITSRDVIHSFWVPEFRVKQDAVPGKVTQLRVTPTRRGEYKAWCAELCGLAHAVMQAKVTVMGEGDWQQWVAEQRR